jgi:hypothetical protein
MDAGDRAHLVRIPEKKALALIPLPVVADLGEVPLAQALALAVLYPHDGWADLVVHQAEIVKAMRVARLHNAASPKLMVRVTTDTTLGRSDWKVKTRSVIVASIWTAKTG